MSQKMTSLWVRLGFLFFITRIKSKYNIYFLDLLRLQCVSYTKEQFHKMLNSPQCSKTGGLISGIPHPTYFHTFSSFKN